MKRLFFLLLAVILFSCKDNVTVLNTYVYIYEQDARFDAADINKMMEYQGNQVKDNELNDSIRWNNMTLIDSTFLPKSKRNVYIYKHLSKNGPYTICYTTKDKTKLVAYFSNEADSSIYYVIKNIEFRKIVLELLEDKKFAFYQLYEKPLPGIEIIY